MWSGGVGVRSEFFLTLQIAPTLSTALSLRNDNDIKVSLRLRLLCQSRQSALLGSRDENTPTQPQLKPQPGQQTDIPHPDAHPGQDRFHTYAVTHHNSPQHSDMSQVV